MWDLPGPGLEPVSPALAGGFLTTAPPGKSPTTIFANKTAINETDKTRAALIDFGGGLEEDLGRFTLLVP